MNGLSLGARYLLISVSCFALVNLSVKFLSHLPFHQLVFLRAFICLVITYAYLRARGISIWGTNRRMLLLRGFAGTIALTCFFYTLHAMPLASAVTIQYLSPILTVLVAVFFGESPTRWHWFCSVLGFSGVWLIQGFDARVSLIDAAIGVVGALGSAFAYNSVRSLRTSDHEWVVIFYFPLVSVALVGPWTLTHWQWPELWDWPLLVAIGVLTQVAQLYLTKGYQADRASAIAAINYLGVFYAITFGVFFFAEQVPLTTALGMALILISVALSSLRRAG